MNLVLQLLEPCHLLPCKSSKVVGFSHGSFLTCHTQWLGFVLLCWLVLLWFHGNRLSHGSVSWGNIDLLDLLFFLKLLSDFLSIPMFASALRIYPFSIILACSARTYTSSVFSRYVHFAVYFSMSLITRCWVIPNVWLALHAKIASIGIEMVRVISLFAFDHLDMIGFHLLFDSELSCVAYSIIFLIYQVIKRSGLPSLWKLQFLLHHTITCLNINDFFVIQLWIDSACDGLFLCVFGLLAWTVHLSFTDFWKSILGCVYFVDNISSGGLLRSYCLQSCLVVKWGLIDCGRMFLLTVVDEKLGIINSTCTCIFKLYLIGNFHHWTLLNGNWITDCTNQGIG